MDGETVAELFKKEFGRAINSRKDNIKVCIMYQWPYTLLYRSHRL